MDTINAYSYKPYFKKEFKMNETGPKPIKNYNQEEEFIIFINNLSSLIKEFYITTTNIIKLLKNNSFELNKYILTSKCLLNEMNSKANIQERIKQLNKTIEGINLKYKYINNNLSSFEMNLKKLYNKSNIIFKKIKENKKIKFNGILDINTINTNSSNNNNQIILEQNNINHYNNKINCLKLSLDTNKLNSFSHTNKSNSNTSNSRRIWYTKRDNNHNTINISQKHIKHKNFDLLLGETDFLEKRVNKNKVVQKDNSNRLRRRNNSQSNILTDIPIMPISNLNKIINIFENTPEKKRVSSSTQKITPLYTNINNYNYYPYKSKCPSSGNITARRYDDCFNGVNLNNFINNKKPKIIYDSSSSENLRIDNNNNILELLENIIEYFYLLSQYQNIIISTNKNIKDSNNIFIKLQNALITLNKSIFINNKVFFNKNFIKQKLLSLIKQNENMNQRLKLLISRINYKNIIYNNDTIDFNNNINETNTNNYKKIIEKLKNDNKTLILLNQKNLNNNKILIQKLNNIKEKNINNKIILNNSDIKIKNNKINNLLQENKEYLFQIKNLKNDNEELLKLLKNKNNNKELLTNNSNNNSDMNQLSNVLESYSDKDNNNFIKIQKNNEIKKLQSILEEIKSENNKLKDIDKEKNNKIKKLNEIISSLKNKYNTNLILINEKNSIIEELNIKIKYFENEINNNKNKYNKDINILKEQIEKNNQIIENKNTDINNINLDKLKIEKELINIKKEIINKNEEIQNLNNKCQDLNNKMDIHKKEVNNEIEKTRNNNNIIEKEKEIKNLNKKIIELQKENNSINEEKNNCLKIIEQKGQEINQLDSIINVLKEKIKEFENNINNKNNENDKIDINDIENNVINYKKDDEENKNKNDSNENINQYSIEMEDNNNENQSKRLSTPSFKSPEIEEDFMNKNKSDNIIEIKKLNELLLKKITEYEINQKNEEEGDNIINNEFEIDNNINNDNTEIKYFQDKYIYYFKLSKEYQKKCEIYELSNENYKNDLHKAKSEIKELTKKLKENNINLENNNNYVTSLSSIKLNNLYNPNEYIILSDKTYHSFKWFLMKKKNNEEDEENDTYDNLIWVPKIDIVDLNDFNKYINEDEQNNKEILNLVKKLEEKENIISKLTYKLEKLEKDFEMINSFNSLEQSMKNKNKINNIFKNSFNDEGIINDNGYILSIRKESSKNQKNIKSDDESSVPMEKFNTLLERLNHTEENFSKLQKENIELRKMQKLYLNQNNNNPINIISNDNNSQEIENGLINSNRKKENKKININNSNQSDEEDYYKNKYNELEMKIKILKDQCKNILMKLTIPKKYKEEIKQSLKLFDFSEEETLIIIGDKKNNK